MIRPAMVEMAAAMMKRCITVATLVLAISFLWFLPAGAAAALAAKPALGLAQDQFTLVILDETLRQPWLKTAGDLNGDNRIDLVAGGAEGGGLVAFYNEFPQWRREIVDATRRFSTDGEIADIDGDGRNDIVALTYRPARVVWYEHTPDGWLVHPIVTNTWHDVEVADLDGDGRPDLVGRNQKEWPAGNDAGNVLHICWQSRPGARLAWTQTSIQCPPGEGLLVTDLDGDHRPDIIINQRWYQNLGQRRWLEHLYAPDTAWSHPNTFIAAGDINGDKRIDLILSPSERQGHFYKLSWFEAPPNPRSGAWTEHVIVTNVETVLHFVGAADFDGDGGVDVVTAEMPQGKDPDNVTLYLNRGRRLKTGWSDAWQPMILSTDGSHSMRIVDVDGDGRPDLFGANWSAQGRDEKIKMWLNRMAK